MALTTEEVNLCSNIQYSALDLYGDRTLMPDLKRIELRILLENTCQILQLKGLADKNLNKELLSLITKLEDCPRLNPVEYRNVKKYFAATYKAKQKSKKTMNVPVESAPTSSDITSVRSKARCSI